MVSLLVVCTGTIVGNTYGIAKQGTAIAVKVLNSGGGGSWEYDILAVEKPDN